MAGTSAGMTQPFPTMSSLPSVAKIRSSQGTSIQIPVLGILRGLAALSVCIFHFCGANDYLPEADPVRRIASYGWLGVEMFFVISGFVIPLSLYNRSYSLKSSWIFLIRRWMRLQPPYVASIILIVILGVASSLTPGFRGQPLSLPWSQLMANLFFLGSMPGYSWISPVYWTLAIEFQFYIFIALWLPLLDHKHSAIRVLSGLLLPPVSFLAGGRDSLMFHWLPLFTRGILTP